MPPPCLTLPVFMIYWQRCKGCFDCNLCHDQERCPSGRRSQTRKLVWGSSSPWVRIPLTPFFIVLRRRGFRQPRLSFFGIALGWFSSFLRFFALTEENFLPKFVFSNLLKKTLDVPMILKNDFLDLLHVHRLLKSVLQCHTTPTKAPNSFSFRTIAQFMSKTMQDIAKPQGPTVEKTAILGYFDTSWWCL